MKGVYNLRTPKPRYGKIWDPAIVLELLQKWDPPDQISLKKLTLKMLMLMLLVSGQRVDTLSKLSLDSMEKTENSFQFNTFGNNKQSQQGYKDPILVFRSFPNDASLCIFRVLSEYLKRTAAYREKCKLLFLTHQKPIHEASKDTLSRWAKTGLTEAGIDVNQYSSHSFRAASTSAAKAGGISLEDILATAGWSNSNTFAVFYDRPLLNQQELQSYDQAVLSRKSTKEGL